MQLQRFTVWAPSVTSGNKTSNSRLLIEPAVGGAAYMLKRPTDNQNWKVTNVTCESVISLSNHTKLSDRQAGQWSLRMFRLGGTDRVRSEVQQYFIESKLSIRYADPTQIISALLLNPIRFYILRSCSTWVTTLPGPDLQIKSFLNHLENCLAVWSF